MNKKKIIALVGKEGTRLNEIRDFIIKKYNACPMQYYTTNPTINQQYMTYLNPNDYIKKIFDEIIFIKNGELIVHEDAEKLRSNHGKSIDEIFREVFKC